ncbi:MAG: nucleotide exchange factor GrpE [Gemmatimonas sp.]
MTEPIHPPDQNLEDDAEPTVSPIESIESSEELQRELSALNDKYLRQAAEYDNFRRRAVKERQEASWRGQGELVRGILDALDDITRFAHVDPETVDAKTVVEGVLIVEKKLFKSLAGHGFEIIDPTGHQFDPTLHEAVTTTPAERAEEDHTVAATFQTGYVINGVVLRPARVVVKQWSDSGSGGASDDASGGDGPLAS